MLEAMAQARIYSCKIRGLEDFSGCFWCLRLPIRYEESKLSPL